jgi:hypothetical protein
VYGDDLSDAVAMLASGSYTVTRPVAASLVDGWAVPGLSAVQTFAIVASVQPASGRDVERLPEGLRDRETMALFTATELRVAVPASGLPGDRLEVDGFTFEVHAHERWAALGNFHRYVILKVPE